MLSLDYMNHFLKHHIYRWFTQYIDILLSKTSWVQVFRIIPEFRILWLTLCRKLKIQKYADFNTFF